MAKKRNKIPLVILVLIWACLLFAMYTSLSTLALAIWGDTVMGTVDSYDNRLDNTDAEPNRSRTVSKGYYFTVKGKEYRGYVIYASDEAWPRLENGETRSETIRYLSCFPYINKPSALASFSQMGEGAIIYHIFSPIGCLLLLWLFILRPSRGKKKTAARKSAAPQRDDKGNVADMFCLACGSKVPEGAAFCVSCGVKAHHGAPGVCKSCGEAIPTNAEFCIICGQAVDTSGKQSARVTPSQRVESQQMSLIGFSERCNSPEILAAAAKNRKYSIGCMWIVVLVPLIGFPMAGLLMDDFPLGESLVIGVGIALVMLIVNLFALRRTKRPIWEGTVVNKYSKERSEHRGGEDDNYRTYTEYTTVITTDGGKKKTIVEKDSGRHMYDYLSVGDRVRFHPMFGTYEKYDKSKDRIIYCNLCSMMNPIRNDRCKRCNNLLFK